MLTIPTPASKNAVCKAKLTPAIVTVSIFSVNSFLVRLDTAPILKSKNKNMLTANPINDATDTARPSDLITPSIKAPTAISVTSNSTVGITTSILSIVSEFILAKTFTLNTSFPVSQIHRLAAAGQEMRVKTLVACGNVFSFCSCAYSDHNPQVTIFGGLDFV